MATKTRVARKKVSVGPVEVAPGGPPAGWTRLPRGERKILKVNQKWMAGAEPFPWLVLTSDATVLATEVVFRGTARTETLPGDYTCGVRPSASVTTTGEVDYR